MIGGEERLQTIFQRYGASEEIAIEIRKCTHDRAHEDSVGNIDEPLNNIEK